MFVNRRRKKEDERKEEYAHGLPCLATSLLLLYMNFALEISSVAFSVAAAAFSCLALVTRLMYRSFTVSRESMGRRTGVLVAESIRCVWRCGFVGRLGWGLSVQL
jgi:Na+(H+)/acetate symporter ActP